MSKEFIRSTWIKCISSIIPITTSFPEIDDIASLKIVAEIACLVFLLKQIKHDDPWYSIIKTDITRRMKIVIRDDPVRYHAMCIYDDYMQSSYNKDSLKARSDTYQKVFKNEGDHVDEGEDEVEEGDRVKLYSDVFIRSNQYVSYLDKIIKNHTDIQYMDEAQSTPPPTPPPNTPPIKQCIESDNDDAVSPIIKKSSLNALMTQLADDNKQRIDHAVDNSLLSTLINTIFKFERNQLLLLSEVSTINTIGYNDILQCVQWCIQAKIFWIITETLQTDTSRMYPFSDLEGNWSDFIVHTEYEDMYLDVVHTICDIDRFESRRQIE